MFVTGEQGRADRAAPLANTIDADRCAPALVDELCGKSHNGSGKQHRRLRYSWDGQRQTCLGTMDGNNYDLARRSFDKGKAIAVA